MCVIIRFGITGVNFISRGGGGRKGGAGQKSIVLCFSLAAAVIPSQPSERGLTPRGLAGPCCCCQRATRSWS